MYQIVTADEQSARDAIRFLTRNQSGRATFLPLTVCQPHTVSRENQIIAQNTDGYLGTAADFVECEPQFEPIRESLLANVLVVNTMENGNNLSSLTKRAYNIVTLDGEVIHRGGSMRFVDGSEKRRRLYEQIRTVADNAEVSKLIRQCIDTETEGGQDE